MFEQNHMATKKSMVAPITVYTNGNRYDSKRLIFNPKYVRTFDALLDQITMQTNATCAVRRIYTPHGSRQVGKLSGIEPGGHYVAVSRGQFKKMAYGQSLRTIAASSEGTTTTKTHRRRQPTSGRLKKSYEDQMKAQKTIYVYRNGFNEAPTQIFIAKRMLRGMGQVLDFVQEKVVCERAIGSLHKLNGVTIDNVDRLEPEGRYVAVEQGRRFKSMVYDQIDAGPSSARRTKLPAINKEGLNTWRSNSEGKARHRFPSNDSNQGQTTRMKPKIKLPVIKQNANESRGFQIVYGYPNKDTNAQQITHKYRHEKEKTEHARRDMHRSVFYATGEQRQIGAQIYNDKRVRIDKPLDMTEAQEIDERLDDVNHHDNGRHWKRDPGTKRLQPKPDRQSVTLPQIARLPQPPPPKDAFHTKPSIAHPSQHAADRFKRSKKSRESGEGRTWKSLFNDQRFVSQDNTMATTKRYIVTREQRLFDMHGRDGREPAKDAINLYAAGARSKEVGRKSQELEKRERVEQWVSHTVQEKQREDEIAVVARELVLSALSNAAKSGHGASSHPERSSKDNVPSFFDKAGDEGVKYHRVFGQ